MEANIKYILGVIIMLTVLGGTAFTVDDRFAKADTVAAEILEVKQAIQLTNKLLVQKIDSDQAKIIQARIWTIEDRYFEKQMPDTVLEELRKLKVELVELRASLRSTD